MKALSIRQPWAWLILNAEHYAQPKRIENRTWRAKHRGPLLIHAAGQYDHEGHRAILKARPDLVHVIPTEDLIGRGGLVGVVEMVDCVDESNSPWFIGPHGFVLARPASFPFIPMPGKLGLFDVAEELVLQRVSPHLPAWPGLPRPQAADQDIGRPDPFASPVPPFPLSKEPGSGKTSTKRARGPQ